MIRWQTVTGVVLGLTAGFTILALTGNPQRKALSGPIISECDGHFRELVIQYEPSATGIVTTVYHEFLGALEADVLVHAVCPTRADFDDLLSRIGPTRCKILPIVANHPMTTWSRDRWLALAPETPGGITTILSPLGEAGQGNVLPLAPGTSASGWTSPRRLDIRRWRDAAGSISTAAIF